MNGVPVPVEPRVLSIQSHVVCGYVGNKCAVFPLQVNGIEIDWINSVQFSNHTGYPHWKGQLLKPEELLELFDGLKLNQLVKYSHLLTGYIADISFLKTLGNIIEELRLNNPHFCYVCDPVLGDNGHYYVNESLMPGYRDILIPLADIVVPNQFELQCLTGLSIANEEQLIDAAIQLHKLTSVSRLVVTSSELSPQKDTLYGYGFQFGKCNQRFRFEIPHFPSHFFGTGDLFASLLTGWLYKSNENLKIAVGKAVSAVHHIIKDTYNHSSNIDESAGKSEKQFGLELRLVQNQQYLVNPEDIATIRDI